MNATPSTLESHITYPFRGLVRGTGRGGGGAGRSCFWLRALACGQTPGLWSLGCEEKSLELWLCVNLGPWGFRGLGAYGILRRLKGVQRLSGLGVKRWRDEVSLNSKP